MIGESVFQGIRRRLDALAQQMRRRAVDRLIAQMNSKVSHFNSSKTPAWRAYRRAEKLTDARFLPILKDVILAHPGKSGSDVRDAAYFIMARLLIKAPDAAIISFYIDRISEETDQDIRFRMLTHLGRVRIPPSQPMDTLIEMTKDHRWQIRGGAIYALGCQDSDRCRQVLRTFIALEDHKMHRDDIIQAQAAIMKIGEASDIALLERNLHSSSRYIRESASFVIERIRQRTSGWVD